MIWPIKHHAPRFWFEKPTWPSAMLSPFAFIYHGCGKLLRSWVKPTKVSAPVICVGNIVLGGSGKTPVVRLLAQHLQAKGFLPHIVSRGYGGYLKGPVRVDPLIHTLGEVGDEPLLLSATAPVWVAKDKVAGTQAAIAAGATHILLDDGLQNPSLVKDISVLVVDATRGFGNGCVLPAGPLREPVADTLLKTDIILWIGQGHEPLKTELRTKKDLITAHAQTICNDINLQGHRLFAFCGLGNAQKFYDGLARQGGHVVSTRTFPDHYTWSGYELRQMIEEASKHAARPITTAKDAIRIPQSLQDEILICDVKLSIDDMASLETHLRL